MNQHGFIPVCTHVHACMHTHSIYTQNASAFLSQWVIEIKSEHLKNFTWFNCLSNNMRYKKKFRYKGC